LSIDLIAAPLRDDIFRSLMALADASTSCHGFIAALCACRFHLRCAATLCVATPRFRAPAPLPLLPWPAFTLCRGFMRDALCFAERCRQRFFSCH